MIFRLTGATLLFLLQGVLSLPSQAQALTGSAAATNELTAMQSPVWSSRHAQHAYGLPEARPKDKGTLTVTADGVSFTGKSGIFTIQKPSVVAVNAGNQRVELWGVKGRLLRMAIPDGGGLAAAAVMHHRVDMLTVEFNDAKGGHHGAVFYLPAHEADRAVASLSRLPMSESEAPRVAPTAAVSPSIPCQESSINKGSVLVAAPKWEQAEVPAAYRALFYEHLMDRLRRLEGVGHIYRDGEDAQHACPQYTIRLAVTSFKEGSQVKRAMMGPIGFFVGTTQLKFDATVTDASGKLNAQEHVKATVRGESESTNVADGVAKTLAKRYSKIHRDFEKNMMASSPARRLPL